MVETSERRRPWANEAEFVDYTIDLIQKAPDDHPYLFQQRAFLSYLKAGRVSLQELVAKQVPEFLDAPLRDAERVLDQVWKRATILGVRTYAALSRSAAVPASVQTLDYSDLTERATSCLDEEDTESKRFIAALEGLGPISAVRHVAAMNVIQEVNDIPVVKQNLQSFYDAATFSFDRGVATEYACVQASIDARRMNQVLVGLFERVVGEKLDPEDPNLLKKLSNSEIGAQMLAAPEIYPWPLNEVCLCGQSLAPFIFCCEPHRPFRISAEVATFPSNFEIHRDCCGVDLPGFVCDVCGRVYTWQKGVVDSVK